MASAAVESDAAKYAEGLRNSLINDLFEGEEIDINADPLQDYSISDLVGGNGALSLQDVDKDLEEFQDHEVIKGILEQGRVLKEYSRDIDERLRTVELESIQDYIHESDNMVALHEQIKTCDVILSGMEQMLGKFQSDLGKVSEEIRQLQVQSQGMSTKLKNRRAAEGQLGSFIDQLTISEDLVHSVLENEVDNDYLEYLLGLDKKLKFIREDDIAKASQAKRDLEPALEKLRIKAVTKVREFMLAIVYTLKRPKTNVQIIQTSQLLKYKFFIRFVREHGPDVYAEIRNEYVSIMSKIVAAHFRTYLMSMNQLRLSVISQGDVLGAPEAGIGSNMLAMFGTRTSKPTTEHIFALGERLSVLDDLNKPPVIAHQLESQGQKLPYEVIFRSVHKLLLDSATSEFFFCLDFFEDEAVFKDLINPAVSVVESDLTATTQDIWDVVCVLLMLRINQDFRAVMSKRRVPCLNDYLDRVHLLLWPRLKVLFDNQQASVRTGLERSLFTESPNVHFVTKRYAALAASMLVLMAGYEQDDSGMFKAQTFHDMMDRLWQDIFNLLLRMSNLFKERRTGIIFLIVNYHHILVSLKQAAKQQQAGGPTGGAAGTVAAAATTSAGLGSAGVTALKDCEDQLHNCTALYVDDQLLVHFRDLVEWVKKAEQAQKRSAVPEGQTIPNFGPAQAAPILRDFAARWQVAIDAMHKEVLRQFEHTTCGRDVLQASMTSLLKHYTRLLELLKRQGPEGLAMVKEAVNLPSIMYEIKRLTKA